ncbi:MAG: hypothetical protein V3T83_03895 [Acidobacteriota bacterium]
MKKRKTRAVKNSERLGKMAFEPLEPRTLLSASTLESVALPELLDHGTALIGEQAGGAADSIEALELSAEAAGPQSAALTASGENESLLSVWKEPSQGLTRFLEGLAAGSEESVSADAHGQWPEGEGDES